VASPIELGTFNMASTVFGRARSTSDDHDHDHDHDPDVPLLGMDGGMN